MRIESTAADPLFIANANQKTVLVTPTLTVHATYASGDFVGTSGAPMTFAGAGRVPGGTGSIVSAVLLDAVAASVAAELWLFNTLVTPPADSAAWSVSDADMATLVAVIPFATYYASALNSVCPVNNIWKAYQCAAGDSNLYGCIVTRGAPAYIATGDVKIALNIALD